MPRSSGCRRDVVFFGRKTILICVNFSSKSSGWHGALSRNKIIFRFSLRKRPFSFLRISSKISASIQAFDWLKYWHGRSALSAMPLKHLGFADFPMMIGLSFPPLALTKRAHVRRSLDLFPPVQLRDLSARDLLGRALKNWPVLSIIQMFSGDHPCKISGSLSLHDSAVSSLTPPASPDMHLALMPFLFLNRSSHPFEALKSSCDKSKASAICLAFSCNIGPVTGIFLLLAFRNQSNIFFSISSWFAPLHRFVLQLTFDSKSFTISSLFRRMLWIWVLLHSNFPATFLLPTLGFASQNWITSKRVFKSSSCRFRLPAVLEVMMEYYILGIYNLGWMKRARTNTICKRNNSTLGTIGNSLAKSGRTKARKTSVRSEVSEVREGPNASSLWWRTPMVSLCLIQILYLITDWLFKNVFLPATAVGQKRSREMNRSFQ